MTQILETVPLLQLEKLTFPSSSKYSPKSKSLILVLLHDLLLSPKKKIEASDKWPPKEAILKHQARLRAELVKIQIKAGKSRIQDLAKSASNGTEGGGSWRYVRWNPNIGRYREGDWSLNNLHKHLVDIGFMKVSCEEETGGKMREKLDEKEYMADNHLGEEVLVFNGNTNWWNGDKWYEAGAIILQDKASCMPAKVLMQGWRDGEGSCIDAT